MSDNYFQFDLKTHITEKGNLTAVEFDDNLPFTPKRIYTVWDNKIARGGHCHKKEEEIFYMVNGSCKARLHNGKDEIIIDMKNHDKALYVANYVWHEFYDFSDDSVMLCLSSTHYNPNREDYIEDFNLFLENVQ
jgi:dTDP-4-dehydrorhamnose 3,5-epimerase-like enzyme